jgi:hypothetical protein
MLRATQPAEGETVKVAEAESDVQLEIDAVTENGTILKEQCSSAPWRAEQDTATVAMSSCSLPTSADCAGAADQEYGVESAIAGSKSRGGSSPLSSMSLGSLPLPDVAMPERETARTSEFASTAAPCACLARQFDSAPPRSRIPLVGGGIDITKTALSVCSRKGENGEGLGDCVLPDSRGDAWT